MATGSTKLTVNSITNALPAGTNAIGKLAANSGVDIGDVDITSIAAGDNNIGNVDIVTMPDATVVGKAAHDASVSGNPVLLGGYASAAAPTDVSADGDVSRLWTTLKGALNIADGGGNISIDDGGNTITVDGTVAVTNAGLTALNGAISGTEVQVDVLTMPTTTVQATNLDIRDLSSASDTVTVHGDVGVVDQLDLTNSNPLAVAIVDSSGDQISSFGGGTQYTEDAAAAANPVGTALIMVRDDALSGSLTTTDGDNVVARGNNKGELYVKHTDTIPATQSGTWNVTNISGTVSLPTGAATSAKQDTIIGHVDGIEGLLTTIDTDTGNINTDTSAIKTSVELIDDIIYTDDTSTHSTGASKGALLMAAATPTDAAVNANDIGAVAMTTDRKLHVSVQDALPAGTNAIGKLAANSGVDIGDVDITSIAAGDNNIGNVDIVTEPGAGSTGATVPATAKYIAVLNGSGNLEGVRNAGSTTNTTTGMLAAANMAVFDDTSPTSITENQFGSVRMSANRNLYTTLRDAAGNERGLNIDSNGEVGISAIRTSITPGTAAGNLGKAEDEGHTTGDTGVAVWGVRNNTPNTATTNADADYSQISTDMVGGIRTALYETDFAVLGTNHVKKYYTNAGAVTDGIVWSPAAGKRWYVTDIFINVSAAATVTLEDDLVAGDSAVWKAELAANSGWSHHFGTPLFSGEDAADLLVTTSAGNVYITITGYEI